MTSNILRAGAASVGITPSDLGRTFLAGFGLGRRARGVLEPLAASVLHLESEGNCATLVSLDLIGLPRVWTQKIRRRVRDDHPDPSRIMVASTHTHSGPDTIGFWGRSLFGLVPRSSGVDERYMERLVERVARGIDRAVAAAKPARVRAASFGAPSRWTRNDREGGARYDHAVALAVEDEAGDRIATVLNHACHPETLWRDNTDLSPDFPGAFRRRSEELAGGVAIYLSGPLGAMLTPNVDPNADLDARRAYAEAMGLDLAARAEKALAEAEPLAAERLHHAVRPVQLENRNWRFRLFQRLGWLATTERNGHVECDVHHVRLGNLELLSAPGELAPEVGEQVRATMRARHRMVVGLCDDEVGYVLGPGMWRDREYRYETTMSLGPRTADTLLDAYRSLTAQDRS